MYSFIAHDRSQKEFTIEPHLVIERIDISSLMHGDTFDIINNKCVIVSSLNTDGICGILKMDKKIAKQKNKTLYKCIPDNNLLPIVLIPIKDENNFNKHMVNRYVLFKYINNDLGQLTATIGPVNNIENFNNYQLNCKKLKISNKKFTAKILKINHEIGNHTIDNAITIDSSTTQDYDDAISYNNNCISIHISNVPLYMEKYNLWSDINRVSTIYLPNEKHSMLPNMLTDSTLSLRENLIREVFSMNINFNGNIISEINFSKDIIKIKKNHVYESRVLLNNPIYISIMDKIPILIEQYPYCRVHDSYSLIEYLMIFMNAHSALKLKSFNVGIYRSLTLESNVESYIDDPILRKFVSYWRNSKSEYTIASNHEHQLLHLSDYVHITSPIRRLVDIVNMMMLQHVTGIHTFSSNAIQFYDHHTNNLTYINDTVKSIKRVQNNCEILKQYYDANDDLDSMHDITFHNYDAFVIEVKLNNEYVILLNNSKYIGKLFTEKKLILYDKIKVQIFIFTDKSTISQKIQITLSNV